MGKPRDLVDREREWGLLEDLFASPRPELLVVLGRRRVGKTFLLAPFARSVGGLYYQATRRTEAEQLHGLTQLLGTHFHDPALQQGSGFPDWRSFFLYLLARAGTAPFLLVLD
ncbi:MAG: ATP-binding protein [Planctomycetota bacterium]